MEEVREAWLYNLRLLNNQLQYIGIAIVICRRNSHSKGFESDRMYFLDIFFFCCTTSITSGQNVRKEDYILKRKHIRIIWAGRGENTKFDPLSEQNYQARKISYWLLLWYHLTVNIDVGPQKSFLGHLCRWSRLFEPQVSSDGFPLSFWFFFFGLLLDWWFTCYLIFQDVVIPGIISAA